MILKSICRLCNPYFTLKRIDWILLKIGTCGFGYDDWKGVFYPESLKSSDYLPYYSDHFDCLELNSSYYAIPSPSLIKSLYYRTPQSFSIVVKAFQGITHHRDDGWQLQLEKFLQVIDPIASARKLSALLFQFPYSFRRVDRNVAYLDQLLDLTADWPRVIEFRHRSLWNKKIWEILSSHSAGYVCVDEPELPGLMPREVVCTSPMLGYLRFHGRNSDKWYDHDESWERYDYDYKDEELKSWLSGIGWLEEKTEKAFIMFNNHRNAQAVHNAVRMKGLLGLD